MENAFLIGPKVFLRPLDKPDAPAVVRWFNDEDVRRMVASWRPLTLAAEEAFIASLANSQTDFVFAIVARETGALVGCTGLHQVDQKNRHAVFGIVVGEKGEWGKGYGTEASWLITGWGFDQLNLNRIWLHVHEENIRAAKVYEKVGYKHEGVLKQHAWRDGQYWDIYTLGLVRADWKQLKAQRRGSPP